MNAVPQLSWYLALSAVLFTIGVVGVISMDSHVIAIASTENPKPITGRGCERSTIFPTNGASTPVAIAIGAVSSADRVGDNPHTACA